LSIGRPQVLLPGHLEQELTARALCELRVANYLIGRVTPQQVVQVVRQVCSNQRYERTALQCAESVATRYAGSGMVQLTERCCELLV
jgi:UDP:flavonoid glycosyltransferase YjiC (YdhE family)